MTRRRHGADAGAIGFTLVLSALVAIAAAEQFDALFTAMMLAVVAGAVAFFLKAFPGSRFFAIAFANGLAIYACLFAVFTDVNFAQARPLATRITVPWPTAWAAMNAKMQSGTMPWCWVKNAHAVRPSETM